MIFPWPTADEERAMLVGARAKAWEKDGLIDAAQRKALQAMGQARWRSTSPTAQVVFFGLTLLAMGAFFGLLALMKFESGALTAIPALVIAEWLIRKRNIAGYGIETALWAGGLFAILAALPHTGDPEALLVCGAACGLAGWRTRNAWFGAAGLVFIVGYVNIQYHGSSRFWEDGSATVGLVIGVLAALALLKTWRRPSTERLFAITAVVMPAVAYASGAINATQRDIGVVLVFAFLGGATLFLGLRVRHRALLLAGAISIIVSAIDARQFVDWNEWMWIAAGTLLAVVSVVVSRMLRGHSRGLVVTKTSLTRYDEAMQIGGAIVVANAGPAPTQQADSPQHEGGGGEFGGAGASGNF